MSDVEVWVPSEMAEYIGEPFDDLVKELLAVELYREGGIYRRLYDLQFANGTTKNQQQLENTVIPDK